MELSGQQYKQLVEALLSAFPDKSSLEQMLFFELDKNLAAIAGEGSLEDVIFKIIQRAEAEGWIKDLIRAACKTNPGNPKLQAIAQKYLNYPKIKINLPYSISHLLSRQTGSSIQFLSLSYSSSTQPLESPLLQIPVTGDKASEVDMDYTGLCDLLQQKKYSEADFETTRLMLRIANRRIYHTLKGADFEDFSLLDLNTIDKLWLAGSNNKFGFSIQPQVWTDVGGKTEEFDARTFKNFVRKLEWDKDDDDVPSDKRAKKGYLPKGLYVLTRGNDAMGKKIKEKYRNYYDEYFNKQLDDERKQRKEAEEELLYVLQNRPRVLYSGDPQEQVKTDNCSKKVPRIPEDPYFTILQLSTRLKDCNLS